jgi:hypothetical protein
MTAPLVQHSSASNEHYSPSLIVSPGRQVLGHIDLDPASCAVANETIRADVFFTREQDGLTKRWDVAGPTTRVWCNPPGGTDEAGSVQRAWWFRAARAWVTGEIGQAIFVCFNLGLLQTTQIEVPEGLPLPLDFPLCFPSKRIAYNVATEENGRVGQPSLFDPKVPTVRAGKSPPGASAIVYLPRRTPGFECRIDCAAIDSFHNAFSPLGRTLFAEWNGRVTDIALASQLAQTKNADRLEPVGVGKK